MDFNKAQMISRSVNEWNDCTVKAISIACDVPYKVAHKALANEGRRNRCGCYGHQQKAAIKALGFKVEMKDVTAKTMGTVARDKAVQDGHFLVYVRAHVAAVVNGKVEDWTEGRRHRVISVYKVTPAASRKERKRMQKELFA